MKKKARPKKIEYKILNIEKYCGTLPVICRSSWEEIFCKMLDTNPGVIRWSSESHRIPYRHDDGTMHTYFPDFFMEYRDRTGKIHSEIIEIKPSHETKKKPRNAKNKKLKTILHEKKTIRMNQLKWKAAEAFCVARNYKFRIITEHELFGKHNQVKKRKKK